ncbi:MAG: transposase, IS605 OrfB family [Leptospirillum sp. Group IV 'UBA BS']|nr:MAG: transposase, IS605 OrfB family [Leptospirillum sp. Group IV 'UBA BS']
MKIALKVKLMTTDEQARILLETMESFNKACDWISERAFEAKVFNAYDLHYLLYKEGRDVFPSLPSQSMIRAIAKVSDSDKLDRKKRHFFRDRSAMEYDKRTLSFKDLSQASLATVRGRIKVPLVFGHYAPGRQKQDARTSRSDLFQGDILPESRDRPAGRSPGREIFFTELRSEGDETAHQPRIVAAAAVVEIVEKEPFLAVFEKDQHEAGAPRHRGLPGLEDTSRSPFRIVPVANPLLAAEVSPYPGLHHRWLARGSKVRARAR